MVDAESRSWRSRFRAATSEQRLSEYYNDLVASGQGARAYAIRHPLATAVSLAAIVRLPKHTAVLGHNYDADTIYGTLRRPGPLGTPFGVSGVAVLDVPADPAEYSLGASKQTLRRKSRLAERAGVTWRPVTDRDERASLLAAANLAVQQGADNSSLLENGLWLAAFAADGRPLLVSVTPTDGEWGHLRYFRTLGDGQEYSDSRYLMTRVLVETLSGLGVRHLVEGTHPSELSNGLRHFQRMVGFRLARVVGRRAPQGAAAEVHGGPGEDQPRAPIPLPAP
jgi:hypothetical protein